MQVVSSGLSNELLYCNERIGLSESGVTKK